MILFIFVFCFFDHASALFFFSHLGIAQHITPVYVSELAPQNIRGTIISGNSVTLAVGSLLGGLFGLDHIFGDVYLYILDFIKFLPKKISIHFHLC